ncbi:FxSxx-COOH system tetratricopeptide repeat protein [Streptomyces sp. NPDC047072]|uniref:FxSxx-COOH system tetratricopeptide repeat protein n=1 Tax=Streptomyces sp. NPDC047072 TaxID=3154809 RepID=UPI0033CA3031
MSGDEPGRDRPLLVDPLVAWPRVAETGCDYRVTVDLRGPLPSPAGADADWPYPEEEFTFTVTLEGAPFFVCAALGEPGVVLHRFGGTYGPARFRVSAGAETGPASLWLTVSNQWGVPVRKAELRSEIRDTGRPPDPVPQPTAVPRGIPDRRLRSRRGGEEPEQVRQRHPGPTTAGRDDLPTVARTAPTGAETPPAHRAAAARPVDRSLVTVTFAGFNRAWAAWIGDRLERRGLRVTFMRWDSPAQIPLVDLLRDLTLSDGIVLMVLSDWFFQLGPRTHEEWNAALGEVVAPDPSRFAAVSVTMGPVPPAAALLEPVDVTNMGAEEAERRLLDRLDLPGEPLPDPAGSARRAPRYPAAMPEVWGGVPRRNTRFTGRDVLLNDAYHLLQSAEPGAGVVTFHGMSGVGKTQVAAEYVYRFGSEYDVVWWVNAETRPTYRRLLAELAPKLGLQTGQEYGERLRAVRDSLRRGEPYGRWLLILDGADEPDQIWDLVPTGPGHVLITSRNLEWSEHNSELLEVPVYARYESVAFIRRRAPRLNEAEADQLAEALEDLPLLLDQTAGWLNDSDLSVREYIDLLEGGIDSDVVKVSADFPLAFQTAWSILLNKLRETVPESVDLLRLCTFFAPGVVPVHLLRETPHEGLPARIADLVDDPLLWNRAINQLRRYSVVRVEPADTESYGESLYLHRRVHQIVRQGMPEADRAEFVDVVRQALAAADPRRPTDPDRWPVYAEIVPNLQYADVLTSRHAAVQNLVLNCLRYMYFSGEYQAGIKLGERAMKAWRSLLGEDHPRIWELTHHYANLLRAAGDYPRTYALELVAVKRLRERRGELDLDYLRALGGLAADLRGLADYREALRLSQQVRDSYRQLLGEQDPLSLNAGNNLAVSLRLLGRYEEALAHDRSTLEGRRSVLRARHPWALDSELSYALDLRLLGRYTEAESIQSRNLRESRLVLGENNPQTLRAEHNLALCLQRGGETAEAEQHFTRVLERGQRVLGESDPLTLVFACGLGCFLREYGDIDLARLLSETVVDHYEASLPPGHPYIAGARANHALVLHMVGERDQAGDLTERALARMKAAVGEDHPWALGCALNAALLRNLNGDLDDALALSRDTYDRALDSLGRQHPLTLSAHTALAADLRELGRRAEADTAEREALRLLHATLGAQHPHTAAARSRTRPTWDFEPQTT